MDEQTGTEPVFEFDASDFGSTDVEQTSELDESPAVEETTEQPVADEPADGDNGESTETLDSKPEIDDEAVRYLTSKGLDTTAPLTERERKLMEMYRNAEKGYQQKSQERAQLERQLNEARNQIQVSPNEEALKEVRALKTELAVNKWKTDNQITPEVEQKLVEWANLPLTDANGQLVINQQTGQPFTKGLLIVNGQLSLDEALKLVGGPSAPMTQPQPQPQANPVVDDLKSQLREEVKKEMVARANAKSPKASATNSTQFAKSDADDPFLKGLGF